jgi:hypothetical protein
MWEGEREREIRDAQRAASLQSPLSAVPWDFACLCLCLCFSFSAGVMGFFILPLEWSDECMGMGLGMEWNWIESDRIQNG